MTLEFNVRFRVLPSMVVNIICTAIGILAFFSLLSYDWYGLKFRSCHVHLSLTLCQTRGHHLRPAHCRVPPSQSRMDTTYTFTQRPPGRQLFDRVLSISAFIQSSRQYRGDVRRPGNDCRHHVVPYCKCTM